MKNSIVCIGKQYGSGGRHIRENPALRFSADRCGKLPIRQLSKEAGFSANIEVIAKAITGQI